MKHRFLLLPLLCFCLAWQSCVVHPVNQYKEPENRDVKKHLIGRYECNTAPGWQNINGMEVIPAKPNYVYLELKRNNRYTYESSPEDHFQFTGKWYVVEDTLYLQNQRLRYDRFGIPKQKASSLGKYELIWTDWVNGYRLMSTTVKGRTFGLTYSESEKHYKEINRAFDRYNRRE